MFGAEVEHFLGLANAADGGAGEAAAFHDEIEGGDGGGFLGRADESHGAVELQELEIGVEVVFGGDRVENEVEGAGMLLHFGFVF